MQYVKGAASRQAHVKLPEGSVEEEHGREGFFGSASHLYRLHPPTGWTRIEGPLRPHAFDAVAVSDTNPNTRIPAPILENKDVAAGMLRRDETPDFFYRNADGDELHFIHAGSGTYETDYGELPYERGDYILIPRGTTYRQRVSEPATTLVIEARDAGFGLPDRGILGRHAFIDQAMFQVPEPAPHDEEGEFELVVKRLDRLSSVFYPFHPLDVIGWKGDLCPIKFNVRDIRPITSPGYHLPPSVHVTFEAPALMISTFVPRPLESDPEALKVPFYHRNIEYDEVIFYHEGEFFSRTGIREGWVTWHPQGIHHGPQPGAVERAKDKTHTNEVAVMIDTRHPLRMSPEAEKTEWSEYWASWQTG
ncbi:MAG: homogentisate 1,2-dioxygenase [Acidimicrobiia bacterium]